MSENFGGVFEFSEFSFLALGRIFVVSGLGVGQKLGALSPRNRESLARLSMFTNSCITHAEDETRRPTGTEVGDEKRMDENENEKKEKKKGSEMDTP